MCDIGCTHGHIHLTVGTVRQLIRAAIGDDPDAARRAVAQLDRRTDPDETCEIHVQVGNHRLLVFAFGRRRNVAWQVWVERDGREDYADQVFPWCDRSDGLTTDEMVTLCRAIRAEG